MANFLDDNADLQYYLGKGVDWDTLASLAEAGYRQPEGFRDAAEAIAFYRDVTSTVGAFAATEVAPHAAEIDRQGVSFKGGEAVFPPRLAAIFAKAAELDLFGLTLPRELGGTNAPMLLYFINGELLARADVSVMSHYGFHGGIAMAMLALSIFEGSTEIDREHGRVVRTRWSAEMGEIASGRAWGSMDITEPDAGSDMAALRTIGVQDASGAWSVSGQKIFITSGHGKYHFVIARTAGSSNGNGSHGGGANGGSGNGNGGNGNGGNGNGGNGNGTGNGGLKDLSMFLVRAYRDEPDGRRTRLVSIDRLEEKLGHHASVTAALTFDKAPAELVGKPGDGFRQMLALMNHARLGVGFEAIGVCEAAFRMARAYAAERRSMGKTIDRHELIADYLDEMEIDIVGLRALAMYAAFHEEVGQRLEWFGRFPSPHASGGNGNGNGNGNGRNGSNGKKNGSTDPADEGRRHRAKARRVLPLLKYMAAEKAVEMARRCLQIHGGNGYMREFGAEKLLRDALVLPIYEGTSQIQSLMATKDTLGAILKAPQEFVKQFAQARFRSLTARDELDRRVARLQCLALGAEQHVIRQLATAKVKSTNGKSLMGWRNAFKQWDPRRDFSFALLHAERLTRLLTDVEITRVLLSQAHRDPERRPLLERYLSRAEPRARFLHDEITSTGVPLLGRLAENQEVTAAQG